MSASAADSSAYPRAEFALGIAAILSAGFVFGGGLPTEFDFIHVGPVGAIVLVVGGGLAIAAAATRRPLIALAGGAVLTIAALAQLFGMALSVRLLGGDASTVSVVGGLGIALLVVALTHRSALIASQFDER